MDERTLAVIAVKLLRGGVAPRHVRRCVAELRAHRADLVEQLAAQGLGQAAAAAEADIRLGDPEDFCASVLARPELRGWASRAPWLVFGLLPLVAFATLAFTAIATLVGTIEATQATTPVHAGGALWRLGGGTLVGVVQWALPLCLCAALAGMAWRAHVPAHWPALGMLALAALATSVTLQLVAPAGGSKGELSVGLGFPPRDVLRGAVLFGAALFAAGLLYLRGRLGSRRTVTPLP